MDTRLPRTLYWSHAPESVYAVLRECSRDIADLRTLQADDDQLRLAALEDAEVVIVAAKPFERRFLDAAPHLRLFHHQGVGYHDTLPVEYLSGRGIRVALTPEGTTTGVAEHTVMLMLAVCKRLPHVDAQLRQGHWHINTYRAESREVSGMTVGFVGFGRIGQAVAARLQAFNVQCAFSDPGIAATELEVGAGRARHLPLDELLATSDVVSLHLPYSAGARHLIDRQALARMKRGAFLINAARGGLVDETALADSLRAGHLGGAGLDCFEQEPPPPAHPLFGLHNVVLTPHTAAASIDALRNKMQALFANIARYSRGMPLANEVALAPSPVHH